MIDKKKYVLFVDLYRKVCPDLQKEKVIQRWAGIVVKSEKRSGTVRKDYH